MPRRKKQQNENQALKIGGKGEVVIYRTSDGSTALDVRLEKETVWLTQVQLAELFQKDRSVITKHLRNIFKEGELEEKRNVQKMHIPFSDKPVAFFNLDVTLMIAESDPAEKRSSPTLSSILSIGRIDLRTIQHGGKALSQTRFRPSKSGATAWQ